MSTNIQGLRSNTAGARPADNTQEIGVQYTNFADGQLGVIDALQKHQDLIAIRYFKDTAVYSADDMVIESGAVYKAKADITTPGVFDPTKWDVVSSIKQDLASVTGEGNTTTDDIIVGDAAKNTTITDGNGGAPGITIRENSHEATVLFDDANSRITANHLLNGGAEYTPTDGKDYVQMHYTDDIETDLNAKLDDRRKGKTVFVENVDLVVGEYIYVATLSSIASASIMGVIDSQFYSPAFSLNAFHVYNDIKYEFALTHYTIATESQFDKLIFTQVANGDPIDIYLHISKVHSNPEANIALDASYTKSDPADPGVVLKGTFVTSVSNIKLEVDITAKDFRSTNVAPGSSSAGLWSEDGTTRLFPTVEYDRTDIGVQGGANLGGKLNIEGVQATTDDMEITGSDVPAANGTYTHSGSNLWTNGSYDIRMEGAYNWVVDVAGNTGWSTTLAYKQSNLSVPNGSYTGYNGHSNLSVADSTGGAVYSDALALKGSMYASDTIKSKIKFLVGDSVSFGATPEKGVFLGGNATSGNDKLLIYDGSNPVARITADGALNLPESSIADIDNNDKNVTTKEYVTQYNSKGSGTINISNNTGGWLSRSIGINETTTDITFQPQGSHNLNFAVASGSHVRAPEPTESGDVATKNYVDTHGGGGATPLQYAFKWGRAGVLNGNTIIEPVEGTTGWGSNNMGYPVFGASKVLGASGAVMKYTTTGTGYVEIDIRYAPGDGSLWSSLNGSTGTSLTTFDINLPDSGGSAKYYVVGGEDLRTQSISVPAESIIFLVVKTVNASSVEGIVVNLEIELV